MIFIDFLPIIVFVCIYVGSGIYFSIIDVENAFYQISPLIAILPAIAVALIQHTGKRDEKIKTLIKGMCHYDIMTMCVIFLLSGAFTQIANSVGCMTATVDLALSFISGKFLLAGTFVTSAIISISIGSSMGTIATIAPLAVGLAQNSLLPNDLTMACVVGGAMFGDNLSLISDTTIAAVSSMQADAKKKFRLNFKIGAVAAIFTIIILFFQGKNSDVYQNKAFSLLLTTPYLFLLVFSLSGVHVFVSLFLSIVFTFFIGYFNNGYTLISLNNDIVNGFLSMSSIMILSIFVGGLSSLLEKGVLRVRDKIAEIKLGGRSGHVFGQLLIGGIVSIFDCVICK